MSQNKSLDIPDLSTFDFPDDYSPFNDENLDMLP